MRLEREEIKRYMQPEAALLGGTHSAVVVAGLGLAKNGNRCYYSPGKGDAVVVFWDSVGIAKAHFRLKRTAAVAAGLWVAITPLIFNQS